LDIDEALHDLFVLNGPHTPEGQQGTPIVIQSFHESSLLRLRELNGDNYALIQLVWEGQDYDYMSDAELAHIASYERVGTYMDVPLNASQVRPWQLFL
jgi:glycerophosphoryl diester phosphodiesterase